MSKSGKRSAKMNKSLVLQIKADLKQGELIQSKIAAKYDINQGRVSEVKAGKWDYLL